MARAYLKAFADNNEKTQDTGYDSRVLCFFDRALLVLVKFRKTPVTQKMVDDEIAQVEAAGLKCSRYGFFSRSEVTAEPNDKIIFIPLDQLYC